MHFPERFAAVVGSKEQLREALAGEAANGAAPRPTGERKLAFLFSGQASQYPRMGAELYRHQPVFRQEVDRCAEIVGNRPGQQLTDVLLCDQRDSNLIDETAYTQPALFAVQAGLIALWRSWGIIPDVVLGAQRRRVRGGLLRRRVHVGTSPWLARRTCRSHAGSAA